MPTRLSMAKLYSDMLTELLDRHCPAVKVRRKAKEKMPWYDAHCRAARRQARAAERRFRRSLREDERLRWMGLLRSMRALYEDKKTRFWRDEIAASKGDSSKLWRAFRGVLGNAPPADSDVHTADDFATFFNDKVNAVRASTAATPLYDVPHRTTTTMTEWRDVTSDEVGKLINAAPSKCQSDPAATWLVKDMRGLLAAFLYMLFNKSVMMSYILIPCSSVLKKSLDLSMQYLH